MKYKVCIQAAGVGSRLTIGKGLHKALIPINKKSVISRIIDLFPKNTSFIIIVGYQKEQIISFINARYPNLDIEFVEVKKFSGKGVDLATHYSKLESSPRTIYIYCM